MQYMMLVLAVSCSETACLLCFTVSHALTAVLQVILEAFVFKRLWISALSKSLLVSFIMASPFLGKSQIAPIQQAQQAQDVFRVSEEIVRQLSAFQHTHMSLQELALTQSVAEAALAHARAVLGPAPVQTHSQPSQPLPSSQSAAALSHAAAPGVPFDPRFAAFPTTTKPTATNPTPTNPGPSAATPLFAPVIADALAAHAAHTQPQSHSALAFGSHTQTQTLPRSSPMQTGKRSYSTYSSTSSTTASTDRGAGAGLSHADSDLR